MYQNFYHFKKEPFNITPDPEFLFLSPSHKQALASIIYGVEKRKGFLVITGEVGTGKTTILRSYLEMVRKQELRVIYVFNANVSFEGLLKTIDQELGLDARTDDIFERVNHLHQFLIGEYEKGHNVVLIIDEAQNMPVETLENLRMLSNLETSKDKLLQIVMIGQPELEKILNLDELRQLKQRIAIRSTIYPFNKVESMAYINHRLEKVALKDTPVFTRGALKGILKQAKGIPRTINILCDNALITGFGYQKKPVNSKIVKEVISDFEGKARRSLLRWALTGSVALLFIIGLFFVYPYKGIFLSEVMNLITPYTDLTQTSQGPPSIQVKTEAPMENREPSQATEISEKKEADSPPRLKRVVKKGDNLFRLTKKVYGYTDDKLVGGVKQSNPRIKDVNKILIGEEIIFPEIRKSE